MSSSAKRVLVVVAAAAAAVPLMAIALAHACTGLATINASPSAVASGATITVSGSGFSPHDPSDVRTEPAKVRFDSQTGPVVATASPSSAADGGRFSVTLTVPQLASGDHVVVVTQNGGDGRPAYGTPARQVLKVVDAVTSALPAPAAPGVENVPIVGPVVTGPSGDAAGLKKAIRSCNKRYSSTKAKTKAGKRRMSRSRAACVSKARDRFA